MITIGTIKINTTDKNKDEVRKEMMEALEKQFDNLFDENKAKEEVKEENRKTYLHMNIDETADKDKYETSIEIEGRMNDLLSILANGTAAVLRELNDNNPIMLMEFLKLLSYLYMEGGNDEE